jgi:hypothetical protein
MQARSIYFLLIVDEGFIKNCDYKVKRFCSEKQQGCWIFQQFFETCFG